MTERFSTVYSLPQCLYAYGAPVLIAGGDLFRDTVTGMTFAQFSIRNLSEKPILSAVISVTPLDAGLRPIGEAVERTYSNLNVQYGQSFGKVPAVTFAEPYAVAMTASVIRVVFENGSEWTTLGTSFEPLPEPETLEAHLNDDELVRQYRLTYGKNAKVFPIKRDDLWCCTCGEWNRTDVCHACRNSKEELLAFDLFKLADAAGVRLARERADADRDAADRARYLDRVNARAKKTRLRIILALSFIVLLIAGHFIATRVVIPNRAYVEAVSLYEAGQYKEAIALLRPLGDFRQSYAYLKGCRDKLYGCKTIAAGDLHTFAIKTDGTVLVTPYYGLPDYDYGQGDVTDWTDLVEISAGWAHTVGLKKNGRVVATGNNEYGQCDVSKWSRIVSVRACYSYTMGLRSDGTVVVTDDSEPSEWKDIVAIDGSYFAFGLRSNGTVITERYDGFKAATEWTRVTAIAAGLHHFVALRWDGTVLAVHDKYDDQNDFGQSDVSGWTDIIAVAAGDYHTVGLKSDGTVVAVGDNEYGQCDVSDWTDIVAIFAGAVHTVGLRSDGTVETAGFHRTGQRDTFDWTDIRMPNE